VGPVFSILTGKAKLFIKEGSVNFYVRLLCNLVVDNERYRAKYGEQVLEILSELLQRGGEAETIARIYNGFCLLSDAQVELPEIDSDQILKDLEGTQVRASVASYLLRSPPQDVRVVPKLLELAKGHVKYLVILLKMASESKAAAKYLAKNHGWLSEDLPTCLDTLRLFLVLLRNEGLRNSFMAEEGPVVEFFVRFLKQEVPERLSISCTILKRLPLTEEFVGQLSQRKFIRRYFEQVQTVEDGSLLGYGLVLLQLLASVCYTDDMVELVDLLVTKIREPARRADLNVRNAAIAAASYLAKYRPCADKLREEEVVKSLKKNPDSTAQRLIDQLTKRRGSYVFLFVSLPKPSQTIPAQTRQGE
jgi:hypothetical protein